MCFRGRDYKDASRNKVMKLAADGFLRIYAASLRSLEIERTVRSNDGAGSLVGVFGGAKVAC